MDGDNLQDIIRQSVERGEQRLATALGNVTGAGNALAAQQGASLPVNARPNGQLMTNGGGLNGSIPTDDPDYDPFLDTLPSIFISYWMAGQTAGSAPVAPY